VSCNTLTGHPNSKVPAEQKGVTKEFEGRCIVVMVAVLSLSLKMKNSMEFTHMKVAFETPDCFFYQPGMFLMCAWLVLRFLYFSLSVFFCSFVCMYLSHE